MVSATEPVLVDRRCAITHKKKQQFRAMLYAHAVNWRLPSVSLAETLSVKPNNKSKLTTLDIYEQFWKFDQLQTCGALQFSVFLPYWSANLSAKPPTTQLPWIASIL